VGVVGNSVGVGEGIKDGDVDGKGVVGYFVGAGLGTVDGNGVGDGDGIADGLTLGTRVVGIFVGLGDGINDGLLEGIGVVGRFVGAGVGMKDGIGLGEGDGIIDGLNDGIGVVGRTVGDGDGRAVGLQVVHVRTKLVLTPDVSPNWKTYHWADAIGGVLLHSPSSSIAAIALLSSAINQAFPCSAS